MRFVGLDIGEKRVGVAVSDPSATVASPETVIDASGAFGERSPLVALVEELEAQAVVVGLPLSLDGSEGPQAQRVRAAAEKLARFLPVPVVFADERNSSLEASRRMREAGLDERRQRGSVDKVAAAIFLQGYLDARRASLEEDGS